MILGQEGDRDVTQLYHEGSDGKSDGIVYINLDLKVGIVAFANTPIQGGMIQEVGWQRIVDYMAKEVGLGGGMAEDCRLHGKGSLNPISSPPGLYIILPSAGKR